MRLLQSEDRQQGAEEDDRKRQKAPAFKLPDENGKELSLSDLKGQTVVLYFYPKASTPGCTTQACGVRDHLKDCKKQGCA